MCLSPLLLLCDIYLNEGFLLQLICTHFYFFWKYPSYACPWILQPSGCFCIMWGLLQCNPWKETWPFFTGQFFPVLRFSKSCSSCVGMWCDVSLIMLHSADKNSWKSWAYVALKLNGLILLQQACACPTTKVELQWGKSDARRHFIFNYLPWSRWAFIGQSMQTRM